MADKASTPPEIKVLGPKAINLRQGRNSLPNGFVDRIQGLWPKQTDLLQRIPGKRLLRQVGDDVLQIHQAFKGPGIIFQIGNTVQYFTLDQLNNRETTPDIEAQIDDEDQVGMAVIVQTETNTTPGGSVDGFLSGSSSASADTFYGRRLTNMWVNETVSALQTVDSFTASTGGSGAASTAGQFVLVPGTYRVEISMAVKLTASSSFIAGLYNATDGSFVTYTGTSESEPTALATVLASSSSDVNTNFLVKLSTPLTVTGGNKTFEIRQKASDTTLARELNMGGIPTGIVTANVNGAAAKNTYTLVTIWRFT